MVPLTTYWPLLLVPPPPSIVYQSMLYGWAKPMAGSSSPKASSRFFISGLDSFLRLMVSVIPGISTSVRTILDAVRVPQSLRLVRPTSDLTRGRRNERLPDGFRFAMSRHELLTKPSPGDWVATNSSH